MSGRPVFSLLDGRHPTGRPPDAYPNPGPLFDNMDYPDNAPGHGGYPPNPGEARPGMSPFGRLAKANPLGKSSIIRYNGNIDTLQTAETEMLRIEGDDLDACQLLVTLAPPRVIPTAFADLPDALQSDPSITQNNGELTTDNFPGSGSPLLWPALEAIVMWGVKGHQTLAVIDFVNGTTFSVVASFLSVHAVVSQGIPAEIAGTSAAYQLAGFVGPGWAKSNAQRTVFLGTIPESTESAVFDVPRFAKRVHLIGGTADAVPVLVGSYVRFWQSSDGQPGGNVVATYYQSGNQPVSFDVPNGGAYFSVYNQSGSPMKMAAVFELGLQ